MVVYYWHWIDMCWPNEKIIIFLLLNWTYLFTELVLFLKFSKMIFLFGGHAKASQSRNACFVAHSAWHVTTHKSYVLATVVFNFSVGMHSTRLFWNKICQPQCASKLQPAMVDISYRCQIKYRHPNALPLPRTTLGCHHWAKQTTGGIVGHIWRQCAK